MKVKKTDRRFKGFPAFKYSLDLQHYGNKNFFEVREWCWQTFGASKEIQAFDEDNRLKQFENNSHNSKWCWHYDGWTRRIYFATDKEANWFSLKWIQQLPEKKVPYSKEALKRLFDDLGPYTLKLSEYDFAGEIYYVVQPCGWMHRGELTWNDMICWVVETFGPTAYDGVWTPGERWSANNARFYFKDVKDRDWFVLRWSAQSEFV